VDAGRQQLRRGIRRRRSYNSSSACEPHLGNVVLFGGASDGIDFDDTCRFAIRP
jgi:hypothetical protein